MKLVAGKDGSVLAIWYQLLERGIVGKSRFVAQWIRPVADVLSTAPVKELLQSDVTAENTTIASESLSGEITGKTYEAKKIHP